MNTHYKGFVLQPYSQGIKAVLKNNKRVLFDSEDAAKYDGRCIVY